MEILLRDLRYARRMIAKRPWMNAAAVVCLAVGIGATTVIYSLVDGVLLSPLPYDRPDEIYSLSLSFAAAGIERSAVSGKEFDDLRAATQIFSEVAGIIGWNFNVSSLDPPQRLRGGRLSPGVFRILGIEPAFGRIFTDEETERGERLAVISHGLWQRAFGGDPAILGQRMTLSQIPYEVIGVMPPDFQSLPAKTEVWVPLVPNPRIPRDMRGVEVLTRLLPGVTRTTAGRHLDDLEKRFVREYPEIYPDNGWGLHLEPLRNKVIDTGVEKRLLAFSGAVLLVLIIACINVANLLLGQAAGRQKEIALRSAFGAERLGLLRQMLTESAVLATLGGVVGLGIAFLGLRLVLALQIGNIPRLEEVTIDARVLIFTMLATLTTVFVFGLVPALRLSRTDLVGSLKEGGRAWTMSGRRPLHRLLVVAELALAGMVLIGTGLMLRSFDHLRRIDPGFRTDGLVAMRIFMPQPAYTDSDARVKLYTRLRQRLAEMPGIERAAVTGVLPLSGFRNTSRVVTVGQDSEDSWPQVGWTAVSPDLFDLLEIAVLQGRRFRDTDHADSHPVVIVDQPLAERLWPGRSPLGQRLKLLGSTDESWRQVVGVVGRIRQLDLTDTTEQLYLPLAQTPGYFLHPVLATTADPAVTIATVRAVMREIDAQLPVTDITTLDELASASLAGARFNLLLFAFFGGAALLLATIGTYGVIAYSVARRTAEIGVRRALGAGRSQVLGMILQRGMKIAVAGVLLGLIAAYGLSVLGSRHLGQMVHGIDSTDGVTFSLVAALLLVTALLANLLPAWRATRIDPTRALRQE